MGFLSGLSDMFGGGQQITGGKVDTNGLLQPPTETQGPGLFERLRTADPQTGLSIADKIYMVGQAASGDGDPMAYAQKQRAAVQSTAERAQRNAAFKAAYQNGKFDPSAYMANLGSANFDPSDLAALQKAFSPHRQVVSDAHGIYGVDPEVGTVDALKEFPAEVKPPPALTPDHIIGQIMNKLVAGQPLSPQEKQIYARWTNGTPSKARAGGSAAPSGLPAGYVPR